MRTVVTSLLKRLRSPFSKKKNKNGDKSRADGVDYRDIGQREADVKKISLVASLEENLRRIKETIGNSYDLSVRYSLVGPEKVPFAFIYIDGLVDKVVREDLLRVVNIDTFKIGIKGLHKGEIYETLTAQPEPLSLRHGVGKRETLRNPRRRLPSGGSGKALWKISGRIPPLSGGVSALPICG